MTLKLLEYVRINSANPVCVIISKINGYFEELNGSKCLTLVPNNESKEGMKKYEDLSSKIRDQTKTITNVSDDYGERYMKIKFNSDDKYGITWQ